MNISNIIHGHYWLISVMNQILILIIWKKQLRIIISTSSEGLDACLRFERLGFQAFVCADYAHTILGRFLRSINEAVLVRMVKLAVCVIFTFDISWTSIRSRVDSSTG